MDTAPYDKVAAVVSVPGISPALPPFISSFGGFFGFHPTAQVTFVAQMVKNLPVMQRTQVQFLGSEDPLEKKWQPSPVFLPGASHGFCPVGSQSQTQLSD